MPNFDHIDLLPRVFNNLEAFDESNKENIGYVVQRPAAPWLSSSAAAVMTMRTQAPVAPRCRALRASLDSSPPRGLPKKTAAVKTLAIISAAANCSSPRKATRKERKVSQSIVVKRVPLQDITHLFPHENVGDEPTPPQQPVTPPARRSHRRRWSMRL